MDHARKRARQEQYLQHLQTLLEDIAPQLAGLSILLDDGYQEPPYPSLNTEQGKQLARSIADRLGDLTPRIKQLKPGEVFSVVWQRGPAQVQTGALVRRLAKPELGVPVVLQFSGVFPHAFSEAQMLFCRSIEGKISKRYSPYRMGCLWLLAYGYDPVILDPSSVSFACSLLQQHAHPFREVWSFFPYASMDLGAIARVWPI